MRQQPLNTEDIEQSMALEELEITLAMTDAKLYSSVKQLPTIMTTGNLAWEIHKKTG
jgi:hypothetical protein